MIGFWLGIINLKNAQHLNKIDEKLMSAMWHLKRPWNWCLPEDEEKGVVLQSW